MAQVHPEAPGREKNRVVFTVTHGGEIRSFDENIHEKLGPVLQKILREFGLVPPPNSEPILQWGDLVLSDPERSLQDYGLTDEAQLVLTFRPRAGGV